MRPLRLLLNWRALLLCLASIATPYAFAGLIADPGFELGKYQSAWVRSESGASIETPGTVYYPAPYAGSFELKLEVNAAVLGSMAFARQSLPASGLQEWTFSGHMLNYGGSPMMPGSYGLLEIVFSGASF